MYNTKWAVLEGAAGKVMFAGPGFSFNASVYTPEEMSDPHGHPYSLREAGSTVVHTDYFMSGIGSASCGWAVELLPPYRIDSSRDVVFDVALLPLTDDEEAFSAYERIQAALTSAPATTPLGDEDERAYSGSITQDGL